MDDQLNNINKKKINSIILKVIVFISLLFIFSKWDTIENYLSTIFK
jgi:regulatory protein YycH of two-component signal transduction system YycFG